MAGTIQNAIDAGLEIKVSKGGTGATTLTDHGVLVGSGTSTITALSVGTDGQVLLGSSTADPVFATLTSTGSTVAFTPGAGTLNLETGSAVCASVTTDSGSAVPSSGVLTIAGGGDVTTSGSGSTVTVTCTGGGGGGITWSAITADLDPMVVDNGYICNKAGLLTLTLPTTAAVGTTFRVTGMNTDAGWKVEQNASQQIHFGDVSTTSGTGGYLASTLKRDSIELVCVVADTEFNVVSNEGNITVV